LENKNIYFYRLFGLGIRSQWEFPDTGAELDACRVDLELIGGSSSLFLEACKIANINPAREDRFRYAVLPEKEIYLLWPRLFEFLVTADGRRILGRRLGNSAWESFLSYLFTQVLSFALLRQGIEPLHCTVLRLEQGAVGLIGHCGQGKSTLAAAFLKAGYPLLTDDLLVLKEERGEFLAYPSFPRIKLFPRVARSLLGEAISGIPMNPFTRKLIIPLDPELYHPQPVALKAIFVLRGKPAKSPGRKITIRALGSRQAFLELVRNSFNSLVDEPQRIRRQFHQATRLTAAVPVKSLTYPRSISRLFEVVEAVCAHIKKLAP
jgi:hypothetical protein